MDKKQKTLKNKEILLTEIKKANEYVQQLKEQVNSFTKEEVMQKAKDYLNNKKQIEELEKVNQQISHELAVWLQENPEKFNVTNDDGESYSLSNSHSTTYLITEQAYNKLLTMDRKSVFWNCSPNFELCMNEKTLKNGVGKVETHHIVARRQ